MRRWTLVLWLVVSWCASAGSFAQQQQDPEHYQMLIDEGIREYRLRNFAEARSLFSRANELYPNARTQRALGMAEFELRHYRESAAALRSALTGDERALDARQREEAEQLLARAENFLTHVAVFAEPWPVVHVDGALVPLAPGEELVLEVGDHALDFTAPGHMSDRRQLRAVGGESLVMRVSLLPISVTPFAVARADDPWSRVPPLVKKERAPERAPAAPAREDARPRARKWVWSAAVIASAALAAGLGFGLSGRSEDPRPPVADRPIAIRRGP